MQEDERDVLEVLIFDEIEETVGTCCARSFSVWKKTRRLFEHAANPKRRNIDRNVPLPEAASEVCKANVSD